jgi:hypothetical protein
MNPGDAFDRHISDWLHADAEHRVPEHLDAVLRRTRTERQRPAWSSLERWLPLDIAAHRPVLTRPAYVRTLSLLAILALLIAAIVALAVGSRRPLPAPFGPARNGALISSADGDIFSIDPQTRTASPLVSGATFDFGPVFSRDGTRFLFLRGGDTGLKIVVANADGSGVREITPGIDGLDQLDWSPDSTRIAFLSGINGRHVINVINADGTGLTTFAVRRPANQVNWLPPDGREILFRGEHLLDSDPPAGIFAIRPDGTDLRQISSRPALDKNDYQDLAVSPDGTIVAYRDVALEGRFRVRLLDLRTGRDRVLWEPADSVGSGGPVFSPDGRSILYLHWYADTSTQLVLAPVDGSDTEIALGPHGPLGPDGPTISGYFFTPDGNAVIANYGSEKVERLLPTDGSQASVLIRGDLAFAAYQRLAP